MKLSRYLSHKPLNRQPANFAGLLKCRQKMPDVEKMCPLMSQCFPVPGRLAGTQELATMGVGCLKDRCNWWVDYACAIAHIGRCVIKFDRVLDEVCEELGKNEDIIQASIKRMREKL